MERLDVSWPQQGPGQAASQPRAAEETQPTSSPAAKTSAAQLYSSYASAGSKMAARMAPAWHHHHHAPANYSQLQGQQQALGQVPHSHQHNQHQNGQHHLQPQQQQHQIHEEQQLEQLDGQSLGRYQASGQLQQQQPFGAGWPLGVVTESSPSTLAAHQHHNHHQLNHHHHNHHHQQQHYLNEQDPPIDPLELKSSELSDEQQPQAAPEERQLDAAQLYSTAQLYSSYTSAGSKMATLMAPAWHHHHHSHNHSHHLHAGYSHQQQQHQHDNNNNHHHHHHQPQHHHQSHSHHQQLQPDQIGQSQLEPYAADLVDRQGLGRYQQQQQPFGTGWPLVAEPSTALADQSQSQQHYLSEPEQLIDPLELKPDKSSACLGGSELAAGQLVAARDEQQQAAYEQVGSDQSSSSSASSSSSSSDSSSSSSASTRSPSTSSIVFSINKLPRRQAAGVGAEGNFVKLTGDEPAANGSGSKRVSRTPAAKSAARRHPSGAGQVGRRGSLASRERRPGQKSIQESATYMSDDIEHTDRYIKVTNLETSRSVTLTNKELTDFTVRQLNKLVSGFPKQTIHKLKQRRRTLKNRGYAQNCRHKRLDAKNRLERQNEQLREENARQAREIDELRRQLLHWSLECKRLTDQQRKQQQQQQQQQQQHYFEGVLSECNGNGGGGKDTAEGPPVKGGDEENAAAAGQLDHH